MIVGLAIVQGGGANDLNYILKGNDWPGLCATGKYQSPVDLKSSGECKFNEEYIVWSSMGYMGLVFFPGDYHDKA